MWLWLSPVQIFSKEPPSFHPSTLVYMSHLTHEILLSATKKNFGSKKKEQSVFSVSPHTSIEMHHVGKTALSHIPAPIPADTP